MIIGMEEERESASIELSKVGAMMRELHERLCALVPEYWPVGVQSEQESAEPLSAVELEALLWAVGQCPLEDLRLAGVKDRFGDGVGEGALARATAKLQRRLGALLDAAEHETEELA